jgi:hypothetical protein
MNAGEWPDQPPRRRTLTEILSARLDGVVEGDPTGKTYADALAEALGGLRRGADSGPRLDEIEPLRTVVGTVVEPPGKTGDFGAVLGYVSVYVLHL